MLQLIFLFLLIFPPVILYAKNINTSSGFVNSITCAVCHKKEYTDWNSSHHAVAMQIANDKTVLGNFNNTTFHYFGNVNQFHKKNKKFYIYTQDYTQGQNKKYADFEVKYTFGIAPLQQYLLALPGGRLQAFTIAWDTVHNKWISLYPNENITSDSSLHWSQRAYNWNHFCADCHSTHINKNYNAKTASYHTTWSAINVDCQACHGPAAGHIIWAKNAVSKKTDAINKGFVINQQHLSSTAVVETCAPCHSRRHALRSQIKIGQPFLDNYEPEILRENIYFPDGSLQEEDYEYGSFLQSKMYQAGVTCVDCHHPHSLALKASNNTICLQCHSPKSPVNRFPTLKAKNYESPAHHFHKLNTPGAQCINCHMPPRTYMQIDVRRDHYFRIPRPDLTIKYGIPNACNLCHTDKTPQWSVRYIEKWFGKKSVTQSYVDIFALARRGEPNMEAALIYLAQDQKNSSIVRATAIELLQQYHTASSASAIQEAIHYLQPLIRTSAAKCQPSLPDEIKIKMFFSSLTDETRSVRIEAANCLANISPGLLTILQKNALNKALDEYLAVQAAQLDQPEGNFNLGMLSTKQNKFSAAENYFKTAIQLDHHFYPASENLAILYSKTGENNKAFAILKSAIQNNPTQGILFYSLGLLFAEKQDYKNSAEMLSKAVILMPEDAHVYETYQLVLQRLRS